MNHTSTSRKMFWAGWAVSAPAILFLIMDGVMKFFMDKLPPEALEAGAALQWPMEKMPLVGTILLICLALYLIPRTAVLGAILLTGYLGGAIASHVRVSNPLFSHTFFPLYIAGFLWVGLYLRDRRARNILEKQ